MRQNGSRRRALGFGLTAALCALASITIASRYQAGVAPDYGPEREVVVVARALAAGETVDRRRLAQSLDVRVVPERFVPPDALAAPEQALGAAPRAAVPAGSYLLASQLDIGQRNAGPETGFPSGLRPVEVTVAAAGALAGARGGSESVTVDVLAADQPGSSRHPRVRVLARRVPLLGLRRSGVGDADAWRATLGLNRAQALTVIEAENFAREVRLLPRTGTGP